MCGNKVLVDVGGKVLLTLSSISAFVLVGHSVEFLSDCAIVL